MPTDSAVGWPLCDPDPARDLVSAEVSLHLVEAARRVFVEPSSYLLLFYSFFFEKKKVPPDERADCSVSHVVFSDDPAHDIVSSCCVHEKIKVLFGKVSAYLITHLVNRRLEDNFLTTFSTTHVTNLPALQVM